MTSRPGVRTAAVAAVAAALLALGVVLVRRDSGISGSGAPAPGLLPAPAAGSSSAPAPGSSSASAPSSPSPSAPGPTSGPGSSPTAAPAGRRFLADLAPRSGAASVRRVQAHSLRITCATGDRTATVEYGFPAAGVRSLATGVGVSGAPGTQVRIGIFVDGAQVVAAGGTPGSTGRLSWSGDPAASLRLRVTCDPGATAAVLTDPQVTT